MFSINTIICDKHGAFRTSTSYRMLLQPKIIVGLAQVTKRTFKNFGHKRQPIPLTTSLWHGFLTLTFTGMCLNWDKFRTWMFGEDLKKLDPDWDDSERS